MSHCTIQLNASSAACEDIKNSVPTAERKDLVFCPKPRRLGILNHSVNDPFRSIRWHLSYQSDDSKPGADLMDIILSKGGGYGNGTDAKQAASSPPFFCGSPPSRATNPLIQDARFGEEKITQQSPLSIPAPLGISSSPSSSSTRKGGSCVRAKFGHKPAAVRIEGFDCLERDRRSCSIPAVA